MSNSPSAILTAVVIPTFNAGDLLEDCLASVEGGQTQPDWVFVIDNHSGDDAVDRASQCFPRMEFVRNGANFGFGAACNQGIELAFSRGAEFVLLLNQDAFLEPNTLSSLIKLAREQPRAGAIGCKTLAPAESPGTTPRMLYNGSWQRWLALWQRIPGVGQQEHSPGVQSPQEVDYVWGHAMLLRCSALRDVGLFDPRFFMYMEDLDLCDRLQRAGWQNWCDSRVVCWHAIADSARGAGNDRAKRTHLRGERSRKTDPP
jgi:N-acetylglucosaminyl-diphospho-decaprenol L-rhamnosyltransferase